MMRALQQTQPGPRADAADTDDLASDVDKAKAVEQVTHVLRQA
jgi:hypothetical protein